MKSDAQTVQKRVKEVLDLRLLGALPTDIRRHAEEQGWNVSGRQLQRYTAEADKLLAEAVEHNRDKLMAHHYAARRALFARAMGVSDYGTALRVLQDEAQLLNLYPPRRTALEGAGGGPVVLSIKEEVVGRPAVPALANIVEEVVTHGTHGGTAGPDDPPAPRTTRLPQE